MFPYPVSFITNSIGGGLDNTYSLAFDGVDDFVDTGITTTGTNDVSISCWIKTSETFASSESRCAFGGIDLTFGANYTLGRLGSEFGSPDDMKVRVFNTFGTTKLNDNSWHNIIYTYDYTSKEVKVYVDGNTTPEISATVSLFRSKKIAIGWNGTTSSYHFEGNVDECAYFTSILGASDITSIYNSGEPADLTPLSPVGWWRIGEDATFSTNWSLPDNGSGSNTGTSANMTIADLEGNAPNYTGGGLSANMTIEDRVGDAPNSTSNALSYNMTESDRETDVPT